ncbi:MAG: stage V sporulation protein AC [Christensenellales bacterium]|jgi:stage V sporulation protein AC|nr:stage V sporulation protein AC [Clostridiales bacterium]
MKNKEYLKTVKKEMPKTKHLRTMLRAFLVGGLICCVGQGISDILKAIFPAMTEEVVAQFTIITIITITGILTGLGVYDEIGNFGGAGSIIPITGFANSIVSPAIEHKREGYIFGLCANMFSIAGPVIVFGITASIIVGLIALIFPGWFAK